MGPYVNSVGMAAVQSKAPKAIERRTSPSRQPPCASVPEMTALQTNRYGQGLSAPKPYARLEIFDAEQTHHAGKR